jgi:glyoxylase-like metal-dependent hydrolase (beta-lactamase superfamily II)
VSPADGGVAALEFPHAGPPAPGTVKEVAKGVYWLRMPLPFALDHINLWLLEDGDGWTIVDTGLASGETRALWERVFAAALHGRRVKRILVTHFHPDHIGLAGWLAERWDAPLWTSEKEWLWARSLSLDTDPAAFFSEAKRFYHAAGLDEAAVASSWGGGNPYLKRVGPIPRSFHRLADGDSVGIGGRTWRVIVGCGHAPEHVCLWCPELAVFIAGDQVLPKISPNVSLWPTEPEGDPLALYLESLERIRAVVPADVLVLPSHNMPFRGLHERIGQLVEHHEERLALVESAVADPRTAADIVPVLFRRKLDAHQLGFAVGEALAHLQYLVRAGRISRRTRPDGVHEFRRA